MDHFQDSFWVSVYTAVPCPVLCMCTRSPLAHHSCIAELPFMYVEFACMHSRQLKPEEVQ